MVCFYKVSWLKTGVAKDRLPKMSTKFAPRLRARAIRKPKPSKLVGFDVLLEVELRKICTTPALESDLEVKIVKCTASAREKDLEVKIVKNWQARSAFGNSNRQNFAPCLRARAIWKSKSLKTDGLGAFLEVDFDMSQNTWQVQEFVRVAKTLAGLVDLKRVRNDAFRVAGAGIVWSVMSMFEASDAESVDHGRVANFMSGKCYFAGIISRGNYRNSYASAQLFRGRRNTSEASA